MCMAERYKFEKTISRGLKGSTIRDFRKYYPNPLRVRGNKMNIVC
jgi:hypothetical protein